MKHLRLTHLRIVLQYENCRDKDGLKLLSLNVDEDHSRYIASEQDLHHAATGFFNAMPTLQCVLLTTCGYTHLLDRNRRHQHTSKWLSSKAWRVLGVDEDPSDTEWRPCMEISGDEAEAVIAREELQLGSWEQVSSRDIHICADYRN